MFLMLIQTLHFSSFSTFEYHFCVSFPVGYSNCDTKSSFLSINWCNLFDHSLTTVLRTRTLTHTNENKSVCVNNEKNIHYTRCCLFSFKISCSIPKILVSLMINRHIKIEACTLKNHLVHKTVISSKRHDT